MREFNFDLLIGKKVAVNCKTKDEEEEFLKYLDRYNIKWSNGCDIFKTNEYYFDKYKENTCFAFEINKSLIFSRLNFFKRYNYEIIPLDFLVTNSKNNFKDYGFEADFEGEILRKTKHNIYIGYVVDGVDTEYAIEWNSKGDNLLSSRFDKNFNLKPIKKEWYENLDNIGKIISYDAFVKKEFGVLKKYKDNWVSFISLKSGRTFEQKVHKCRPATKEEVLSLLVKE